MEDEEILELYWSRSERAVAESSTKYGPLCSTIAYHILGSHEDTEECVSDTWFRAWESIPPQKPRCLSAFLGKITRNLALNRLREGHTAKRGGGETALVLEELEECCGTLADEPQSALEGKELARSIERFLRTLPARQRNLFLQRYWYLYSLKEIAAQNNSSESRVKQQLFRMRNALKKALLKEGIVL